MSNVINSVRRKALVVFALFALAALAVTAQAGTAEADPADKGASGLETITSAGTPAAAGSVGINGIGSGVYTTINTASLFQCPYTSCNQGIVANGIPSGHPDDVAAICQMPFNSPWGHHWTLVLNHANNQVGFIDIGFLRAQYGSFSPPTC